MADDQEKTEEATPERRKKAREEGQFPRGKDAGNTLGSLCVLLLLIGFSDSVVHLLGEFSWRCFHEPFSLIHGDFKAVAKLTGMVLVALVLPFAFAAALGASAAGVSEAGYQPRLELAAPKWNRLDPLSKLKQMFSPKDAAVNISLQLARVLGVAVVAYLVVKKAFPVLVQLSRTQFERGVAETAEALLLLALWTSGALTVLVAVDYLYNRHKHEKQIMMSQQEIKDEHKQQEGDPRVRARQRAKAREMAKRSVAQGVKEADFIIVNPTHVSVAIRYRPEEGAPIVATKGYDEVALYIRELAKQHQIPIIENIPLARTLASRVRIGRSIPIDLYAAVAEVLAFVYRLKSRQISA